MNRISVILDTDIGNDIDDTWALALLLKSPELDVKLITSATGNTLYRAKLIARLLETAGRSDVPVGIGLRQDDRVESQGPWVESYELERYPGTVHADGVGAMVETILGSPEPVTVISIGPLPNVASALQREPRIAPKARFVGMHGSIRRQLAGEPGAVAEYNVVQAVGACQAVFAAPWISRTITPLDTCGVVQLLGKRYQRLCRCSDPLMQAVMKNYWLWAAAHPPFDPGRSSSILFDTVAVHLAYSTQFLSMQRQGIRVTDDGYTVIDPQAAAVHVAMDWVDLEGYCDFLVERLLA